jgi:rubredoxin
MMNNISIENCQCGGTPYVIDDTAICPDCRKETKLRESSLDSSKGRSDYYRSETFEEYFDEAQGRRKKPIPPEVYQTISSHCSKHNIQEATLTKNDVLRILKQYKLSDYYKSINLICHVLLGTPLPEIQEYRQRCLERHRLIEEEYMEMRQSENRSNFLYAWYVLRACLHMEGYNAKSEDFITLTTREAAIEHNKFMIKICERIRKKQQTDSSIKGNWNFEGLR